MVAQSIAFRFRRRYNLPPTDPRFLAATPEDMLIDVLAHHYADNPNVDETHDDDFDMAAELAKADEEAGDLPDDFEDVK